VGFVAQSLEEEYSFTFEWHQEASDIEVLSLQEASQSCCIALDILSPRYEVMLDREDKRHVEVKRQSNWHGDW
jgi:hypothetical protein